MDKDLLLAISEMMDTKLAENNAALLNEFNAVIDSKVTHDIQLLAEGHQTILDRLPDADEQEQLKSRVKVLERVVIDLRTELDELKKAQ